MTLELLCGPSGVGKTSSIDKPTKSFRWTTRPQRPSEVSSDLYDGSQKTDGFFVTEDEFTVRADLGDLVGVHRYPDPETGHWYGFPKQEMEAALQEGETLSEQVVTYEAIDDVVQAFPDHEVVKKLFLGYPRELIKRIKSRSGFDKKREEQNRMNIRHYMSNLDRFDQVNLSHPQEVNLNREEAHAYFNLVVRYIDGEVKEGVDLDFATGDIGNIMRGLIFGTLKREDAKLMVSTLRTDATRARIINLMRTFPTEGTSEMTLVEEIATRYRERFPFIAKPLFYATIMGELGMPNSNKMVGKPKRRVQEIAKGINQEDEFQDFFYDPNIPAPEKITALCLISLLLNKDYIGMLRPLENPLTRRGLALETLGSVEKTKNQIRSYVRSFKTYLLVQGRKSEAMEIDRTGDFLVKDVKSIESHIGILLDTMLGYIPGLAGEQGQALLSWSNVRNVNPLAADLYMLDQLNEVAEAVIIPGAQGKLPPRIARFNAYLDARFAGDAYQIVVNGQRGFGTGSVRELVNKYWIDDFVSLDNSLHAFTSSYSAYSDKMKRRTHLALMRKPPVIRRAESNLRLLKRLT